MKETANGNLFFSHRSLGSIAYGDLPIMKNELEDCSKHDLELVSLDDLARERLSSTTNESINQLELFLVIRYKDEHLAVKADKDGIHLNSKVRFRGLGALLIGLGGILATYLI